MSASTMSWNAGGSADAGRDAVVEVVLVVAEQVDRHLTRLQFDAARERGSR